jgi:hypothetical protein
LQQAGNLLDLTNIFSARGLSSRFAPNIINAFRDKGHQYGIPQQLLVTGLWYNRALFTKYGLQPPSSAPTATTFADLEKDVRVFKQHGIITIAQGRKIRLVSGPSSRCSRASATSRKSRRSKATMRPTIIPTSSTCIRTLMRYGRWALSAQHHYQRLFPIGADVP